MIKTSERVKNTTKIEFPLRFLLPALGTIIVLLTGVVLGKLGPVACAIIVGTIILAAIAYLRQDEVMITLILAVHLYVDWYLVLHLVAFVMAIALLLLFYLTRSPERPWILPIGLQVWILFLALAAFPAANGALTLRDTLVYYPSIVFGALIMFWLGILIARNIDSVRRLFQMLSLFGTLIAIHTIIQTTTGVTLFGSARAEAWLQVSNNHLLATGLAVTRSGSFFNDPNWNGVFLAMVLFIPLGLFLESVSFWQKFLYLVEALVMLPALLFTYSTGSWTAAIAGMIVFIFFIGRMRHRIQFLLSIGVAILLIVILFNAQLVLQLQHSSNTQDLNSRFAVWRTALRVIQAYPLTGIGLGNTAYLLRDTPYRDPGEYISMNHPHNSYLEWGAMAGLPVLFIFLVLVVYALWRAIQSWVKADRQTRSLLGGGLACILALSVNSWSINGWTLAPLAALGWLILGAISSPLLKASLTGKVMQEENSNITNQGGNGK